MFHAWDANDGLLDNRVQNGIIKNSEWQATYNENMLRGQMNLPLRTYYHTMIDKNGNYLGGTGQYLLDSNNNSIKPIGYKRKY